MTRAKRIRTFLVYLHMKVTGCPAIREPVRVQLLHLPFFSRGMGGGRLYTSSCGYARRKS